MKINFIEQRDFSGIFDVSFAFLKQNIGSIVKGLLCIFPFIMIALILMQAGQAEFMESYEDLATMTNFSDIMDLYAKLFTPLTIVGYILLSVASLAMGLYPVCYLILYVKSNEHEIKISDVWNFVKRIFFPILICYIIFGLIINIGFILCIIPGIIVAIYLVFFPYTYAAENASITECFSRSAKLVKRNWWITFGIILITFMLMITIYIITAIPSFTTSFAASVGFSSLNNPILVYITTLLPYLGSLFTTPFFAIVVGAMYYSRIAESGAEPMEQFIENIGTKDN